MTSPSEGQLYRPINDPTQGTPFLLPGQAAVPGDAFSSTAGGQRSGLMLNFPQCMGQPSPKSHLASRAIVPRLRNPETHPPTHGQGSSDDTRMGVLNSTPRPSVLDASVLQSLWGDSKCAQSSPRGGLSCPSSEKVLCWELGTLGSSWWGAGRVRQ